ncbi:immunity 49 family protein [Nocardia sp. NPDC006630]|uniref:immunity 49 family protein n=1 Tax=Nocardia sp. NPDC006630 TaxID=3157181 RepID=UPI0033A60C8D
MPDKVGPLLTRAEAQLGVLTASDPQAGAHQTQQAAQLSEQLATGLFWITSSHLSKLTESVELRFGDQTYRIPAGPNYSAHQGKWLDAFWWARTARDDDAAEMLAGFPIDRLRDTGDGGVADEFNYEWVAILQDAWREGPTTVAGRARSLGTTSALGAQQIVDHLLRPPMVVFDAIASNDEAGLSRALVEALMLHRSFFDSKEWRHDPAGFVSIPLLGLSCWAHDLGMRIDVESEYIPKGFIENPDWIRILDTITS